MNARKNIVICADGTGNAFAKSVSNVSTLVTLLKLDKPNEQCVAYDQGLGTHPGLANAVREFARSQSSSRSALTVLSETSKPACVPMAVAKLAGLALGYGLRANVLQMYQELSRKWCGGDRVFLFGFSRGAFTVRALAGLIYRCGLVRAEFAQGGFEAPVLCEAYELYTPHEKDSAAIEQFRKQYGAPDLCEIHFLGLWDTVKAYGGIWPKSLPHLRHNPIVRTVRHALALAEQRSWYIPTSWGGIDSDDPQKLGVEPDEGKAQDVREVWFTGCHSDVGGGDIEAATATIPLRWILREAMASGAMLDSGAEDCLASMRSGTDVHESLRGGWLLSEYVPRWELDNSTRPPKRYFKIGRTGKRRVEQFSRRGKVEVHQSAKGGFDLKNIIMVD